MKWPNRVQIPIDSDHFALMTLEKASTLIPPAISKIASQTDSVALLGQSVSEKHNSEFKTIRRTEWIAVSLSCLRHISVAAVVVPVVSL